MAPSILVEVKQFLLHHFMSLTEYAKGGTLLGKGKMTTESLTIEIDTGAKKELDFLFKSGLEDDIHSFETVENMLSYILHSIADGSRRPGAWERQILEMTGIVPNNPIFHEHRSTYGNPQNKD